MSYLIFNSVPHNPSQLVAVTQSKAAFQVKCRFEFLCNRVNCIHRKIPELPADWLMVCKRALIDLQKATENFLIQRILKKTVVMGSKTKRQVPLHM